MYYLRQRGSMPDTRSVLYKIIQILDAIEERKTEEKDLEVLLKDGSILRLVIIYSDKKDKAKLEIVKPS